MQTPVKKLISPGLFGSNVAADTRRSVYDAHNEALLAQDATVDVVFIGDSITELWALDAYFHANGSVIVNRGIGGDVTPYIRRRFAADALQLAPQLVVILAGINNFWDLDNWLHPELLRTPQAIEDEIVDDIAAMTMAARTQQIQVALCSILPTNIPFNSNGDIRNTTLARVNARLRTLAAVHGAIFVDYHSQFVDEDRLTLRAGFADDGLHPHAPGYKLMATMLLETLRSNHVAVLDGR